MLSWLSFVKHQRINLTIFELLFHSVKMEGDQLQKEQKNTITASKSGHTESQFREMWWVNDDTIFIFGWTIPSCSSVHLLQGRLTVRWCQRQKERLDELLRTVEVCQISLDKHDGRASFHWSGESAPTSKIEKSQARTIAGERELRWDICSTDEMIYPPPMKQQGETLAWLLSHQCIQCSQRWWVWGQAEF